jgi:hypothetical protein
MLNTYLLLKNEINHSQVHSASCIFFAKPKLLALSFLLILFHAIVLTAQETETMKGSLAVTVDKATIEMGRSVRIDAAFIPPAGEKPGDFVLLPYVNQRRWGHHEFTDSLGHARFMIPLPNVGKAEIVLIALPRNRDLWYGLEDKSLLRTGTVMPEKGIVSNELSIAVSWRDFPEEDHSGSVFAMQYEPWFHPDFSWSSAHAIPLMGFYDCTNPDVLRQHVLWLMDMGIDCMVIDWSNHIWGAEHWKDRSKGAVGILHMTELLLEVLADMRDEGLPIPRVALMPGLSNGPPATMTALNEQFEWVYRNYLRNDRFNGLWQLWDGKPLIIVLDTGAMATKEARTVSAFRVPFFKQTLTGNGATEESLDAFRQEQGPVDDTHFTVRWMSSQNQVTGHDKFGYWSWMDGSLKPVVTYRDGEAEAITVATAFFAEYGWKAPEAYGRKNGWTYLQSFQEALEKRPSFIMFHQFQEYTGQAEGHGYGPDNNIYVDSYSVELSDDIEPVSLTAPGYRGDQGGWGFFYANMTRAMIDIFTGEAGNATLIAVAPPEISVGHVAFEWTTIGPEPSGYVVYIDGKPVEKNCNKTTYAYPREKLSTGEHTVKVVAKGVSTPYRLSKQRFDRRLKDGVPVETVELFTIE